MPAQHNAGNFLYPGDRGYRVQVSYLVAHRLKRKLVAAREPAKPTCLIVEAKGQEEVFIGIPKVATRSILGALQSDPSFAETVRAEETTLSQVLAKRRTASVSVLVRNPYSRALSCWRDKIARLDPNGHRARRIARYAGLYPAMTFDAFAEWLTSRQGRDDLADRHWMSQQRFFEGARDVSIQRLEDLEGQLTIFGRTLALPRQNATTARSTPKPKLSESARHHLAVRYADDFTQFGYQP